MTPIITCEHAGNLVPPPYAYLFADAGEVLNTHRGWDPGALQTAQYLAAKLDAPLFSCEVTRLLVEVNRSLESRELFSEYSQILSPATREEVLERYYFSYRGAVEEAIQTFGRVLHLSIHSFTPSWNGVERDVDLGFLFDPTRKKELAFCEFCATEIRRRMPVLRVRFNEPYKGIDDGFTTHLRKLFPDEAYQGIEIEINQQYNGTALWESIPVALYEAIRKYLS